MPIMLDDSGFAVLAVSENTVMVKDFALMCAQTAQLLPKEEVEAALQEIDSLHTVGILDPSGYMRSMKSIEQITELMKGFLTFQRSIEKVKTMT